jgi:uncharacterized delta-60 repeat protein
MLRAQKISMDVVGGWVVTRAVVLALVVGLVVLGYTTEARAAPGELDASFGSGGKVTTDFADDFGADVAVQDDGKVVVAGSASTGATGGDFALARYNPNGTLDSTFSGDGKVTTAIGAGTNYEAVRAVAIGADGKIVVVGVAYNGTNNDFAVARYNPSGSLDTSFGGDGIVLTSLGSGSEDARAVALQGTKIVVVGASEQGATGNDFAVVRYSANGDLDSTFSEDGKTTTDLSGSSDIGYSVALQPGGKIVVAGRSVTPSYDFSVARYNPNGSLDSTFSEDGKTTTDFFGSQDEAIGVALQEDGRIVAAGWAYNGTSFDFALARYNADGSLDGEFDEDGKTNTDFLGNLEIAYDVAIQDDGRIVAAGASASDLALVRYNADGTLNNSFSNDGRAKADFGSDADRARGVALQTDGKIVAGGSSASDFILARYFGGNDDEAPRVSTPTQTLQSATALGTSTVPVRISWSATDAQGDVTRYELQRSTDGGAYAKVALATPTTATLSQSLSPNHNYRYRVRATDDNGNTSFFEYGPRFTVDAHQETSTSMAYTGLWRQQLLGGSYGGQVKFATAAGSTAKLTFTGQSVAWVAPKGSTRGKADVLLDGRKVATVDLSSSRTLPRRVVYAANGLSPSVTHTLQVKVLGTTGRPRVDVDAFVVLR